jgi:hypothetical protein
MSSLMIWSFHLKGLIIVLEIQLKPNESFLDYLKVLNIIDSHLRIKGNRYIFAHRKSSGNEFYLIFLMESRVSAEVQINIIEDENLFQID